MSVLVSVSRKAPTVLQPFSGVAKNCADFLAKYLAKAFDSLALKSLGERLPLRLREAEGVDS